MAYTRSNNDLGQLCADRSTQMTNLRRERRQNLANKRRMELLKNERTDGEVPVDIIRNIILDIKNGNVLQLQELLKLLNNDEVVDKMVYESEVMRSIILMINQYIQNEDVMFTIVSIFINYSSSLTNENTYQLMNFGLSEYFVPLLQYPSNNVSIHMLWLLANICADGNEIKRVLIEKGIVDILPVFYQNNQTELVQSYLIWFFMNLLRNNPKEECILNQSHYTMAFQFALLCLQCQNEDIISDALQTIQYISMNDEYAIEMMKNPEFITLIMNYTTHQSQHLCLPTLRILGNLMYISSQQTIEISRVIYPKLLQLTTSDNPFLLKEVYFVIANILTLRDQQCYEMMIQSSLIATICTALCARSVEIKVRIEMGYCLCNILYVAQNQHLKFIIQNNPQSIIALFCICDEQNVTDRLLLLALKCCRKMIQFCTDNGIDISDVIEETGFDKTIDNIIMEYEEGNITRMASTIKENYLTIDPDSYF